MSKHRRALLITAYMRGFDCICQDDEDMLIATVLDYIFAGCQTIQQQAEDIYNLL